MGGETRARSLGSRDEAKVYEGKVRGGNILIAVHVEERETRNRVEDLLKRGGAKDVTTSSESAVPSSSQKSTSTFQDSSPK